jgi:hypothetical protein
MHFTSDLSYRFSSVKYQPKSDRYYFDVGFGSICRGATPAAYIAFWKPVSRPE